MIYFPLCLKNVFPACRIWGWWCFFFRTWKASHHLFLARTVLGDRFAFICIGEPQNATCSFALVTLRIFYLSLVLRSLIVAFLGMDFGGAVHSVWNSLGFRDLSVHTFRQMWDVFSHHSLVFFFSPPRSPSGTAMALSVRTFLHHLAGPRVSVHFCFQPVFPPRPAALGLSGLSESTASLPGQLQNAIEPVQWGGIFFFLILFWILLYSFQF